MSGATMGDMPRVLTFAPCPTCSGEVTNLIQEGVGEDQRYGSRDTYVIAGQQPIELVPCGHLVRGYKASAEAHVSEWTVGPQ